MDFKNLKVQIEEGIATVTVSRPEALNALNTNFFHEMNRFLEYAESAKDISVIILTGEGKAFVAGADIAEMVSKNQQEGTDFSVLGQKTFDRMEALDIPIIAAVNGFALGGGCELAMACDFRIASKRAKFGQPEVNLGLIPGYAGTQRLPRLVGLANALYMLMTADMISADEAFRIGLVQKLVESEELLDEANKVAKLIASKGPTAVKLIKKITREGLLSDFGKGCALEANSFGSLFGDGKEGREGMTAFLEKRNPNWN